VNGEAGDGRTGDADRGHGDFSAAPMLSAEGKLRRAANASRGIPFRDGRKRGEPQDRQRSARRSRRRGGGNRRGGGKPRGRNADGGRQSHPEGRSMRSGHAPQTAPGRRTPRRTNDGGAIFGQHHERKPGDMPGRKDRNASVIGAKVRRVAYTDS